MWARIPIRIQRSILAAPVHPLAFTPWVLQSTPAAMQQLHIPKSHYHSFPSIVLLVLWVTISETQVLLDHHLTWKMFSFSSLQILIQSPWKRSSADLIGTPPPPLPSPYPFPLVYYTAGLLAGLLTLSPDLSGPSCTC
jgi:hypothetical protein